VNEGVPYPAAGDARFTEVSAGRGHGCALDRAGKAWCWGTNRTGESGVPPAPPDTGFYRRERGVDAPVAVTGDRTFAALDAGGWSNCALDAEGKAYCWGGNWEGQLGIGHLELQWVPTAVLTPLRFTRVRAGDAHACALTAAGELRCGGSNSAGQIGRPCGAQCGTPDAQPSSPVPLRVETGQRFVEIDLGAEHTCALTAAGAAYCWGKALNFRLGSYPGTDATYVPTPVATTERFAQIAAGYRETCGVRADGVAFCWGIENPYAPLPQQPIRRMPGAWLRLSTYGYSYHTTCGSHWCGPFYVDGRCGIAPDGTCSCWGNERSGELGNGGWLNDAAALPTPVGPLHAYDLPPQGEIGIIGSYNRAYSFYSTSSDDYGIVRTEWSFGDGGTAEGNYVSHTWTVDGLYPVTITVYDARGQRGMHTMLLQVDGYPD
jgi:hypothetical protein